MTIFVQSTLGFNKTHCWSSDMDKISFSVVLIGSLISLTYANSPWIFLQRFYNGKIPSHVAQLLPDCFSNRLGGWPPVACESKIILSGNSLVRPWFLVLASLAVKLSNHSL